MSYGALCGDCELPMKGKAVYLNGTIYHYACYMRSNYLQQSDWSKMRLALQDIFVRKHIRDLPGTEIRVECRHTDCINGACNDCGADFS